MHYKISDPDSFKYKINDPYVAWTSNYNFTELDTEFIKFNRKLFYKLLKIIKEDYIFQRIILEFPFNKGQTVTSYGFKNINKTMIFKILASDIEFWY